MTINRLTASFGKLENETLRFHDGLNVIHAPNESGKSTWCAFIRAMLYGIDSSERAAAGKVPDKQRYAPWSGAAMEGQMDLTADRCDITLTRTTRARNAPMREFSAVYTGTNVPVEGLDGTNAGEQLTGVTRDVFRRSAFIEQGSMAVSGSPDLERRINAIVTSGEEGASFSEADERLRAWLRKRRHNRRGLLPELEERIEDTRRLLDDMDGSAENIEGLEKSLEACRAEEARLEQEVTESRRRQRREAVESVNRARAELDEANERHDAAIAHLSDCRSALRSSPLYGEGSLEETGHRVREDLARLADLKQAAARKASPLWMVLFLALAAAAAALYSTDRAVWMIVCAGVFLVAALVFTALYMKRRRAAFSAADERRALLKRYGMHQTGLLASAWEQYQQLYLAAEEAVSDEEAAAADCEALLQRQRSLEAAALADLDLVSGDSAAARLGRELNAKRAERQRLAEQIASWKGRLSAMGDMMVMKSDLGVMEAGKADLEQEFEDISLAEEVLRSADSELQSRFSPELGRVAASYMSRMTSGRYEQVLLNRDFSAMTRTGSETVAHDSAYLSAGTLDLLYLAVRLAVCELALPEGESCPLIIDDALVNLDETRLAQAMDLLKELARKRQIILFPCRKT